MIDDYQDHDHIKSRGTRLLHARTHLRHQYGFSLEAVDYSHHYVC